MINSLPTNSCLYINSVNEIDFLQTFLADLKVTYLKKVEKDETKEGEKNRWDCEVLHSDAEEILVTLEDLALISSHDSRFRTDIHIKNELVDEMYKIWILKIIRDDASFVIVARHSNGDVMGMLTVKEVSKSFAIELIAVFPKYHLLGVGRAMMEKCLFIASARKKEKVTVVTQSTNKGACRFYKSLGFDIIECKYIYHVHK